MRKKITTLMTIGLFSSAALVSHAQVELEPEKDTLTLMRERIDVNISKIQSLSKLKVSGYVQLQAEFGQYDTVAKAGASTKVGNATKYDENIDGTDADSFMRYGIRRGRIKFDYAATSYSNVVFQLDITDGGIGFKDAYYQVFIPCEHNLLLDKVIGFKFGIFDRPFGDEISYSSSRRESPERSIVFQKLFPDERDLGGMLMLSAPKNTLFEGLKLDAGLFSGNGIRKDDNSKLDFIGHLKFDKKASTFSYGIGASYYNGSTNNAATELFTMKDNVWTPETVEANERNKREYYGIDAQFSIETFMGITNVRGEALGGTQPSTAGDIASPKGNTYDVAAPFNYNRKFKGGHIYFIQDIYKMPLTFVFKYCFLDPNIEVSGDNVTNKADLTASTIGIGGLWRISSAVRLQAFYEINKNETSGNISAYKEDIRDNLFTLRLQYKF
ncbi:MAG: hypothetical protein LBR55_07265 [Bacteroidales bacterium]|jgi:hypothetical protein|nr:hypothetical protein [Bacteroidales bacterium]